jgi:hypothetical protein
MLNHVQAWIPISVRMTHLCRVVVRLLAPPSVTSPLHPVHQSPGPRRSSTYWEDCCYWHPLSCSLVSCLPTAGEEKHSCNANFVNPLVVIRNRDQRGQAASREMRAPEDRRDVPSPGPERAGRRKTRASLLRACGALFSFCTYYSRLMLISTLVSMKFAIRQSQPSTI